MHRAATIPIEPPSHRRKCCLLTGSEAGPAAGGGHAAGSGDGAGASDCHRRPAEPVAAEGHACPAVGLCRCRTPALHNPPLLSWRAGATPSAFLAACGASPAECWASGCLHVQCCVSWRLQQGCLHLKSRTSKAWELSVTALHAVLQSWECSAPRQMILSSCLPAAQWQTHSRSTWRACSSSRVWPQLKSLAATSCGPERSGKTRPAKTW